AYSAHLEVFCGLSHRIAQFAELLEDAYQTSGQYLHQLLFGDMNTLAHSLARLSPKYCQDRFRWRSWGSTEAQWWFDHVLSTHRAPLPPGTPVPVAPITKPDDDQLVSEKPAGSKEVPAASSSTTVTGPDGTTTTTVAPLKESTQTNPHLEKFGTSVFPREVLRMAINPGFSEPWDLNQDNTLQNFYGLYKGKLDWTLLMGFECLSRHMGNENYLASDHKYLIVYLAYKD
ncbi:hypothetical protein H4R33_007130, partial [Dimargaris cristalligena]